MSYFLNLLIVISFHDDQLEERCRVDMESHKHMLDKEYEALLTQFSKELEKLRQVSWTYHFHSCWIFVIE